MFKRPMMGCLWLESAVDRVEVASLRKKECTWNQLNASTDKAPVRLFFFLNYFIFLLQLIIIITSHKAVTMFLVTNYYKAFKVGFVI